MGSYLHFHEKSDHILIKHFTPEAAGRILESPWSEKEQRAVSTLDKCLDKTIRECDDMDWMDKPEVEIELPPDIAQTNPKEHNTHHTRPGLFNHAPDDDKSLQTFGAHSAAQQASQTQQTRQPITPPRPKADTHYNMNSLDNGELTLDDDITIESRMKAVEVGLQQVNTLSTQFEQLIQLLGQGGATPGLAELLQHPTDAPASTEEQGCGL